LEGEEIKRRGRIKVGEENFFFALFVVLFYNKFKIGSLSKKL